jgi:tripartite-type tricarboxylate transporter receptor subunit TctC
MPTALVLAGLGAMTVAPIAGASTAIAAKKSTPLSRGLAYYQGKTLNFIVSSNAGSAYDIEARSVTTAMAAYLHATINVEDIPGGSGITGQDLLESSPKNGLTIGFLNGGVIIYNILEHNPSVNFNPARMDFLAGVAAPNHAFAVTPGSPYQTFASMLTATAANPITLLTDNGSITSIEQKLILDTFGIHYRIITGYSNSSTQLAGFLRGDGMGMFSAVSTFGPYLQSHLAIPLAKMYPMTAPVNYAAVTANVPTIPQLEKKYPAKNRFQATAYKVLEAVDPSSGEPFVTAANTPTDYLAALRAALVSVLSSSSMKATFAQQGHLVDLVSGAVAKQRYINSLAMLQKYSVALGITAN